MSNTVFKASLVVIAAGFSLFFLLTIVPALLESGDVLGAFAAGFVNPFAAGYSTDVILCWCVLACWVSYDACRSTIKFGWVCLILGIVPGVVVGFALYLLMKLRFEETQKSHKGIVK